MKLTMGRSLEGALALAVASVLVFSGCSKTEEKGPLEKAGAAWVVQERDLDVPKLARLLERILTEPDALRACARAAHSLGRADAAQRLADLAEQLAP